jgi:hypothetical protein
MTIALTAIGLNLAHIDAGGCPESGSMRHTGTIAVSCVGPPVTNYSDSWVVVETYTGDDNYTLVAENSTTRWTYDGNCMD